MIGVLFVRLVFSRWFPSRLTPVVELLSKTQSQALCSMLKTTGHHQPMARWFSTYGLQVQRQSETHTALVAVPRLPGHFLRAHIP